MNMAHRAFEVIFDIYRGLVLVCLPLPALTHFKTSHTDLVLPVLLCGSLHHQHTAGVQREPQEPRPLRAQLAQLETPHRTYRRR